MSDALCKGSGLTWKTGSGRSCPVCRQSYGDIAIETGRTGTGGKVPRHKGK